MHFSLLTALPTEPKTYVLSVPLPLLLALSWVGGGRNSLWERRQESPPTNRRLAGRQAEGVWRGRTSLALSVVLVRPEHTHAEQMVPSLGWNPHHLSLQLCHLSASPPWW